MRSGKQLMKNYHQRYCASVIHEPRVGWRVWAIPLRRTRKNWIITASRDDFRKIENNVT